MAENTGYAPCLGVQNRRILLSYISIVYYLIYMKSTDWKPFYEHSLLLFQFLEQHSDKLFLENERTTLDYAEDGYGVYSTAQNSGYAKKLPVAPRFMHAVCRLHTTEDLHEFEALLQRYQSLYAQTMQQDLNEVRFPFIMPRLLDAHIYQININSSKAFSSRALHPKDGPVCLQNWSYDADDYSSFEWAFENADAALAAMHAAGFPASLREAENRRHSLLCLDLDVAALCRQLGCAYLQHRIPTGTQYKAQLLYRNQDTVRDSLGVFVLRPEQSLDLYHAIPRKTRKDALYVDQHPDEVVLPIDVSGNYYQKHKQR